MVPFGVELAEHMRARLSNEYTHAMERAAQLLLELYQLMSASPFDHGALSTCSRHFCIHMASLNKTTGDIFWALKPKMHLLQEMAEYMSEEIGRPKAFWCYTDEDCV